MATPAPTTSTSTAQAQESAIRVNTPPPHSTLSQRNIAPVNFAQLRPKEVKSYSNIIAWNSDGKKLLSVGFDKTIRGWPLDNFEERSTFQLSASGVDNVNSVEGHPRHPDLLCAASERDKKMVFFDFRARAATRAVDVGTSVRSIQFSADGQSVLLKEAATSSGDGSDTLAVYDVRSGQNLIRKSAKELYTELGYEIADARFNHHRNLVYASGEKGGFVVLDYPSLEPLHQIRRANITKCRAIGVDLRGRFVATGGGDSLVNIWDTQEWIGLRSIESAESSITSLAFSHDGEWIASVCESGYIDITESETGLHEARLVQRFTPKSIAWHPSQTLLAVAGGERRSESWINLIGA